ncbi:MAG: RNA polymerase sigma factor [Proteobacteria bacterium]|nr:RNA polymerase sigma factor [Pseudomonadota bacterium]
MHKTGNELHPPDATAGAEPAEGSVLHRYLLQQLRNQDDARDLAQEAYMRYLQVPDMSAVRDPGAYLFRIALNLISEWRLRRDRSAVTYDSELTDKVALYAADNAPDVFEQAASSERLQSILEQIPVTYRRALLMSKCEGLSNVEIAKRINVTPETVVRYLARAVAFARAARWE